LRENRGAGCAKARPLPAQAGCDGPDIRDLAGAEAVDIRRTGLALFRRTLLGDGRATRDHSEQEAKRRSPTVTNDNFRIPRKPCLHRCVSLDYAHLDEAGVIPAIRELNFAKSDFSHTSPQLYGATFHAGINTSVTSIAAAAE
jgi:hypothetical protein